jgi:subtilisin-like proprotein convertase family protein
VGDLIVTLTSPSGTTRTLIDRPGVPNTYYGCNGDNIVVLLSDAASQSVENQCNGTPPAINGTFSPNQTLAAFIGENPSGTWTLTVSDNAGGDTGSIISSTLNVTTTSGTTSVPTSASTPGLAIPDNNNAGVNHIINVPAGGIIQNVTVDLAIDHTRIGDFRVTLTSPSGTTIKLMEKRPDNGPGSCAGDNIDLTLDDAASTAVQAQCGPGVPSISGTHSPFEALAAFIGENSTGNWTLNVSDRRNGETGRLMSATLHITAQQNIPTPPSPNLYFYNFIMENTSAGGVKTQNTDVYIAHHATWTNGVFYSDNNHLLQFINGATSTLPNNGSYADLNVRKIGNQAFNFPTGNGGYAGVIGISAPALTTDHFTARYFRVSPQTVPYDRSLKEATIHHISNCEYWILDRTNGTAAVSVSLSYDNVRSCGVGNPSALKVCRWDGTQWIDHFNGGNFATPYTGLTSAGAVSNFSPFTLGSLVTEDINPLPVSWLGFEAKAQNAFDAVLSWQTAQETDNSHFIVERSRDGLHFQAIGRVEGTNANHISNYSFIDEKAALYAENNHLYYRLRQVDFSGKESYSPIRQVVFEAGEEMQILSLAPNPFQNQFEVRYQIPTQAAVHFALYDMAGRILWQQTNTPAAGTHRQAIEAKQLAKGTYLLKVQYQNQSEVRKVVKE